MLSLIVFIIIIGIIFWLVETYIPMSPPFKTGLRIIAVLIVIVLLLRLVGIDLPTRIR